MNIRRDDLSGPEIAGLLTEHLEAMAQVSPPESRHALDIEGLRRPEITFWTVWEGGELAGCGALKELDAEHGEVKSMRTSKAYLRRGVATMMLQYIILEAKQRGYRRLSLETGSMAFFEPARRLYSKFGFRRCGPFAGYVEDPNSVFMTRDLRLDPTELAFNAVNRISAMVAYWDSNQRCVFSNDAYRNWFGRTPDEMIGMSMKELLGPLYELNLPYIRGALNGQEQVFERQIPMPGGGVKESIATYMPDVVEGVVRGFWVHVADVTVLRQREAALERALQARDKALAEVRTLRGLIPICSYCKKIRNEEQIWQQLEAYIHAHSEAEFSHSICPDCLRRHYGNLRPGRPDH